VNSQLSVRNTFFWDKKAYALGAGDYTKAYLTHWLKSADGNSASNIVESEKPALEARIWYAYDGQTAGNLAGTSANPITIARQLTAGAQLSQFTYNSIGKVLTSKDPVGRKLTYGYDPTGVDLLSVTNTTLENGNQHNELLAGYSDYDRHQPKTVTDAAGRSTGIIYNTRGQVQTITNAKGEVTQFDYYDNTGDSGYGQIKTVTRDFNGFAAQTNYTYDGYTRLQTVTDSELYTITLGYDDVIA
jgi:YD repeat-containing protein